MTTTLYVLIAAVSVNCLATIINGGAASDTVVAPYVDMLLPPHQDVQDANKDAATKINATAKTAIITTTKNPIINYENNRLVELSIEALLPPLFEAKIDKQETTTTTTTTTTIFQRPTTNFAATATKRPYATTATNLKVPALALDPLQPLSSITYNKIVEVKGPKVPTTTQKPKTTTKKSYYRQKTGHLKDESKAFNKSYQTQQEHLKYAPANSAGNGAKKYNQPVSATNTAINKHATESQTHPKQVSVTPQQQNVQLQSQIEAVTHQYVAKSSTNNAKIYAKQLNSIFDLYLRSTTPRPTKNGLPTITPFPHRL